MEKSLSLSSPIEEAAPADDSGLSDEPIEDLIELASEEELLCPTEGDAAEGDTFRESLGEPGDGADPIESLRAEPVETPPFPDIMLLSGDMFLLEAPEDPDEADVEEPRPWELCGPLPELKRPVLLSFIRVSISSPFFGTVSALLRPSRHSFSLRADHAKSRVREVKLVSAFLKAQEASAICRNLDICCQVCGEFNVD